MAQEKGDSPELLQRPRARLGKGGAGQAGLYCGSLARTGVFFLDRRREMRLQRGAFLEQAVHKSADAPQWSLPGYGSPGGPG